MQGASLHHTQPRALKIDINIVWVRMRLARKLLHVQSPNRDKTSALAVRPFKSPVRLMRIR